MPCSGRPSTWVGRFAKSTTNSLGVGKIVTAADDIVELAYFESVADPSGTLQRVPKGSVECIQIPPGTRVYWQEGPRWHAGFVSSVSAIGFHIRTGASPILVPHSRVYVRCNRPIGDATDLLAAQLFSESRVYSRRKHFTRNLSRQRAVSGGLRSLSSSIIRLYAHQIDTVRRVAEDPIQRYLLADEVGLGKTIEAGVLIRQHLQEFGRNALVLILVPGPLKPQWSDELERRFLLRDVAPSTRWHLTEHSFLTQDLSRWNGVPSLVVIDEAHELTAPRMAGTQTFENLRMLAARTPRLLLLSATPALTNEESFLGMLHLLDPDVHRLGEIEQFRERVRDRQAIARTFSTMNETQPPFLILEHIRSLRSLIPRDRQLRKLVDSLEAAIDLEQDMLTTDQLELFRGVRVHVGERYRLHRRLIRHRLSTARPQARGRTLVQLPLGDAAVQVHYWLEALRDAIAAGIDAGDRKGFEAFSYIFQSVMDEALPSLLKRSAATAIEFDDGSKWSPAAGIRAAIDASDATTLCGQLQRSAMRVLVERLRPHRQERKVVIFATRKRTARRVVTELAAAFGDEELALFSGEDPDQSALQRFQSARRTWILVCDIKGEQGLNLQQAEIAVHFDLPFEPNRVEQRIGRLDRVGQRQPVQVWIFEWPTGSVLRSWSDYLALLGVFDRSIASLQYVVQGQASSVLQTLVAEGAQGLADAFPRLREEIASEETALKEQDALDSLDVDEASREVQRRIAKFEASDDGSAFHQWVSGEDGVLRFTAVERKRPARLIRYEMGNRPQVPDLPLTTLTSRFKGLTDRWGTYDRPSAVGIRDARLYRIGEPFFDAVAEFTGRDDRGACACIWRKVPQYDGDDRLVLGFTFVIDAGVTPPEEFAEDDPITARALESVVVHRADRFLRPTTQTVYLDADLAVIEDAAVSYLTDLGATQADESIPDTVAQAVLARFVARRAWVEFARQARSVAERRLRRSKRISNLLEAAVADARSARAYEQFQRRARRGDDAVESADTADLWARVLMAVGAPRIRVDSAIAAVISSTDWDSDR